MPQADMSRIPPEVQQALAAQGGAVSVTDIQTILAELAQDPAKLAAAMQSLGLNVTEEDLTKVAENWIDGAAEDASGNAAAPADEGDTESDYQDEEAAEPAPDDEAAEGEDTQLPSGARPTSYSPQQAQLQGSPPAPMPQGNPAMAAAASGRGGGGAAPPMDDLISAAMMEQAGSSPNARVPQAANFQVPRPTLPHSPSEVASQDPRMKQMIANIYRSVAGQTAGAERAGAPTGARGARIPSTNPTRRGPRV